MPIGAGDLDQRIRIEARSAVIGAIGQEVISWVFDCSRWAKVIETPGREFLKGEVQTEKRAVFIIRWREMDSTARVTWNGTIYGIEDVTGTRRDGILYLHCKSVSGAV